MARICTVCGINPVSEAYQDDMMCNSCGYINDGVYDNVPILQEIDFNKEVSFMVEERFDNNESEYNDYLTGWVESGC